jgi:hypothetical protein
MVMRAVHNEDDRKLLLRFLQDRKLPFTVEISGGRRRSTEQNRLQRLWLNEIAEQAGDRTPEDVRGDAKLRFGVPILRAENEVFREKYDRIIKPLPYETKIELMMEPMDFPVTRLMTSDQTNRYLDAIYRHYTEQGFSLTQPEPSLGREAQGVPA